MYIVFLRDSKEKTKYVGVVLRLTNLFEFEFVPTVTPPLPNKFVGDFMLICLGEDGMVGIFDCPSGTIYKNRLTIPEQSVHYRVIKWSTMKKLWTKLNFIP